MQSSGRWKYSLQAIDAAQRLRDVRIVGESIADVDQMHPVAQGGQFRLLRNRKVRHVLHVRSDEQDLFRQTANKKQEADEGVRVDLAEGPHEDGRTRPSGDAVEVESAQEFQGSSLVNTNSTRFGIKMA